MYLIERIAHCLAEYGTCTTSQLAKLLDEPVARIGDSLKSDRTRGRWGITKHSRPENHREQSNAPNLWSIDKRKFKHYLSERREMPWIEKRLLNGERTGRIPKAQAPKPKAVTIKQPKVDYARKVPEYRGEFRTVWQKCSPYAGGQA